MQENTKYCTDFLATAKKPGLGLLFTVLAGVTNVIGDWILVGVVSQGDPTKAVQGAALATALQGLIDDPHPGLYNDGDK